VVIAVAEVIFLFGLLAILVFLVLFVLFALRRLWVSCNVVDSVAEWEFVALGDLYVVFVLILERVGYDKFFISVVSTLEKLSLSLECWLFLSLFRSVLLLERLLEVFKGVFVL